MNTNQNRRPTHTTLRARLHSQSPTDEMEPTINAGPARKFSHLPVPLVLLPVLLGLSIVACSSILPSPSPTATEAVQPTALQPTATASIAPSETSPPTDQQGLNLEGPWWLFSSREGLFAVNPDGTGLTQIFDEQIPVPYSHRIHGAPSGGHLAFLEGPSLLEPILRVSALPDPALVVEQHLTTEETRAEPGAGPGDQSVEAARAITEHRSLAFSPDGQSLAFMASIEGPTSDLYLLSMEDYGITRLSDGPSQAYQPVWSPDGELIVHTGVSTFGTGADYEMEGVWAARADNSGISSLYDPSQSGAEEIIGWTQDRTFVVYSWDADCGSNNLRTYNIESGQTQVLWSGYFQHVAFDPLNARAVVAKSFETCRPEGQTGLFHVPTNGTGPIPIVEGSPNEVTWSPNAELVLAAMDPGVVAVDSKGQFIDLAVPDGALGLPAVAPGSRELAWSGLGLWIGSLQSAIDNPPKRIHDEPVERVTWRPDGQGVLFLTEDGLYVASRPDFSPILIRRGLDNFAGYADWISP